MDELFSLNGVASVFDDWKSNGESQQIERQDFYLRHLKTQINRLSWNTAVELDHLPVVISGMASSSLGLLELPYISLPFAISGSQTVVETIESPGDFTHDILLISGVRNQYDIIRGEETQLIGILDLLDFSETEKQDMVLIFPGTHSKHIYIHNNNIVDFKTYMTGEVFSLMLNQSILKESIEFSHQRYTPNKKDWDAFRKGVEHAQSMNLLHTLFTVRSNQMFNVLDKHRNYFYLSGLIIGTELKDLTPIRNQGLVLCSGSNIYDLYQVALEELKIAIRLIPPGIMDKAVIAGQIKIFKIKDIA